MTQSSHDGGQEALSAGTDLAEQRLGLLAAFAAYGTWGLLTLYYAALSHVEPLEVVANRVAWSLLVVGVFFLVKKRWGEVWQVIRDPKIFRALFFSSVLISINWLTYIWAVTNGKATEASLGYYILPLVNVAFGFLFLSEKLSKYQWFAIFLAALAILIQAILLGELPIVAIIVSLSFGGYGYIRKTVPVGPNLGLLVELVLVSPFALGYILFVQTSGSGHLFAGDWTTTILLVLTGIATYFPLLWFSAAAKRLRLSTLGVLQYMNPTIQLVLAVFVLGEAVTAGKLVSFCLIWLSVAIYVFDSLKQRRGKKHQIA
ncbi:MAG: EamA family transporter RarD [Cohaesibacter sp.]|jgi:chloramphenicol-sensitive protein RarD|nr:EamA family transporter RarD [Cohaesibacter sp.]